MAGGVQAVGLGEVGHHAKAKYCVWEARLDGKWQMAVKDDDDVANNLRTKQRAATRTPLCRQTFECTRRKLIDRFTSRKNKQQTKKKSAALPVRLRKSLRQHFFRTIRVRTCDQISPTILEGGGTHVVLINERKGALPC